MTLSATQISVHAADKPLLSKVSFSLDPREIVALIGPNGAGKSTLLKSVVGILPHSSGRISLDGAPASRNAFARRVGYVPDQSQLYWNLRVEQVVALGRIPHPKNSSIDEKAILSAMQYTHTEHFAKQLFNTLSHGEQARVMLARALATQPDYLVLDEPLQGLDSMHQLEMMELLTCLARDGMGIVLVLHDFTLALRFATRVVVMKSGNIVLDDVPQKALTRQMFADVFSVEAAMGTIHGFSFVQPVASLSPKPTLLA